jgi:hypothetical protein
VLDVAPIQRGEELFISKIKRQDFIRLNLAEGYQCGFTRFIWDRILCIQQLLQPTEVKQKPLYRANASVLNDPFLRKIFGYQRIARPTRSLKRRRSFKSSSNKRNALVKSVFKHYKSYNNV